MDSSVPAKFTFPFTFSGPCGQNSIEVSLAHSKASALEFWNYRLNQRGTGDPLRAGVLGCLDGSLFLFHCVRSTNTDTVSPSTARKRSRRALSPLNLTNLTRTGTGSTSPSLLSPASLHVPPRSRVVSGINTEQVEATKVYVDFEDEADRLKSLLEGKAPKEKAHNVENDIARTPDPASTPNSESGSLKGKEIYKGSPSMSPSKGTPVPTLLLDEPPVDQHHPQELRLIAHIVPNLGVVSCAVRAVVPIQNGKFFVTLRESGDIRVYSTRDGACIACSHTDDLPLHPPVGIGDKGQYHDTCIWHNLKVVEHETTFLVVSATINPNTPSFDPEENGTTGRSRMVIFELSSKKESGSSPVNLAKMFQWSYNGPVGGIEISYANEGVVELISTSHDGTMSLRSLKHSSDTSNHGSRTPASVSGSALPLPNPFKAMKTYLEKPHLHDADQGCGWGSTADEGYTLGILRLGEAVLGVRMRHVANQVMGLAWSHSCIQGFVCRGHDFRILFSQSLQGFVEANWVDTDLYYVVYDSRIEYYKVQTANAHCEVAPDGTLSLMQPTHQLTQTTGIFEVLAVSFSYEAIYTRLSEDGQRQFLRLFKSGDKVEESVKCEKQVLWEARHPITEIPQPTSLLPLDNDAIIQGYADGWIRQYPLSWLCGQSKDKLALAKTSGHQIDGEITFLHIVQNLQSKERFLVSGADDGSIAFWTPNTLKLCARWKLFITPLCQVIQLPVERTGPLSGCLLCMAQDGTIAVIALDDFQYLYMIPGSAVSLRRICLGETNMLLIYEDRRARLWDTQSREFWRSLSLDKAEELLPQGGWTELFLDRQDDGYSASFRMVSDGHQGPDTVSTLSLDIERFISDATTVMKTISTNKDQTKAIYIKLDQIKLVLSFLLTPGLNEDIDEICWTKLKIPSSSSSVGFSSLDTSTLYGCKSSRDAWCISGDVSAARLVGIASVLRTLGLFEEYMDNAKTVTTFYVASLTGCVGPGYQSPSLPFLAQLWFRSSELRSSCRTVFDASIAKLSDDEASDLVDQWHRRLPSLHTHEKENALSPLALYLCGYLSVEKYGIMSVDVLRDVSKSLALYLKQDKPIYKVLAIDLCSRGFHVWQHYIDSMQILRSLFNLATNSQKDFINIQNVATQARSAVLSIASSNTPLFMTTLGLDILNPPNVEHRLSVLQIVVFLIRKRPTVLHSNLSKLMEAVVKSLDPNSTTNRDVILDTATDIIAQVVKTFPNVDFHGATQRLAVGSNEGAIVMYDLKTATRLYILEGHKKRITSCSFSPDGRRLATVSIDEGLVNVWKVGSSFASFFTPGAPPRQGQSGSRPYKSLNFHFGDISELANSLDSTKFEWVGDRNVRVMIGPNTLFFST